MIIEFQFYVFNLFMHYAIMYRNINVPLQFNLLKRIQMISALYILTSLKLTLYII